MPTIAAARILSREERVHKFCFCSFKFVFGQGVCHTKVVYTYDSFGAFNLLIVSVTLQICELSFEVIGHFKKKMHLLYRTVCISFPVGMLEMKDKG